MTSTPPPGPMPGQPVSPVPPQALPPGPVEWQLVEHVPGDPWSVELMVWSGDAIDGVPVPVDDQLLGALAEVRRRRADVNATFAGEPLPAAAEDPADGTDAEDEDPDRSRLGRWWDGLGRTTGSAQADRWLANVPIKWQLAGAVLLLLVFVLVMIIGRLLS